MAVTVIKPAAPGEAAAEIVLFKRMHRRRAAPGVPVEPLRDGIGRARNCFAWRKGAIHPAMHFAHLAEKAGLHNFHAATESVSGATLRPDLRDKLAAAHEQRHVASF